MYSLELNEFVIQLDEEAEAMQSTILHLQQQLKEAKDTPAKSNPSTKDRTSKPNGPVDGHSSSTSTSSSKTGSRSQDS